MIDRPLYLDKIMPFVDTPFVKILTGVRRCGKSTILKMIIKKLREEKHVDDEQILSYRFDSMEYEDMTTKELYLELKSKIIQSKKTYLFLDEIQEIEGWEKVVNTLASDFDVDIYITGSNSRMMSSEISTYLTGRYITFHIYTLSFEEYLMFKKSYTTLKDLKQEFSQYVRCWCRQQKRFRRSLMRWDFHRKPISPSSSERLWAARQASIGAQDDA